MLDQLEVRLAGQLDRVQIVQAALEQAIPIEGHVDAVVSVAAFHWISDHDRLFHNLACVLRPDGQLVTDCGGHGNIVRVMAAIEDVLGESPPIWNFAGVEDTKQRLARAGFVDIDVALRPDPARVNLGAEFESYMTTVVLGAHLERLPESDRAGFARAVIERLPEPVVDYVRLEIRARRA